MLMMVEQGFLAEGLQRTSAGLGSVRFTTLPFILRLSLLLINTHTHTHAKKEKEIKILQESTAQSAIS